MSAQVHALREMLEQRFPGAVPAAPRAEPVAPTGIDALDSVLPSGGLPRGKVSTWAPGGGASAILRAACAFVVGGGERAVWVDGRREVLGESWLAGPLLVHAPGGQASLGCMEELARSGGFALLVLSGIRTDETERVRLSRAASEGGSALVLVSGDGFMAGLRLASRIHGDGYFWRPDPFGSPAEVDRLEDSDRAKAAGWNREAQLSLPMKNDGIRLSLEPGLVDRRGVTR